MEHRLVLDTVNEVSRALLELVPWRAREGLDKLVSDANEQYKLVSDTVGQRVDEIDAAIQRSQQVIFINTPALIYYAAVIHICEVQNYDPHTYSFRNRNKLDQAKSDAANYLSGRKLCEGGSRFD